LAAEKLETISQCKSFTFHPTIGRQMLLLAETPDSF